MQINEHLEELKNIRNLMERSSRFISLSGLSGISAGVAASIGAGAYWYFIDRWVHTSMPPFGGFPTLEEHIRFLLWDAVLVLLSTIVLAIWFTTRNAKRKGMNIWDATTKRLLLHLGIPLAAGAMVILACLNNGTYELIGAMTLIFYGLALVNASKYTYSDVFYLGLVEIALGVTDLFYPGNTFELWVLGFGVLHIVYGALMYYKYERNTPTPQ
jgi:hypothetical protein